MDDHAREMEEDQQYIEELKKALSVLQAAFECVLSLGKLRSIRSMDTAFAIGQAAGTISKAKALVGRDLDDALYQRFHVKPVPTVQ